MPDDGNKYMNQETRIREKRWLIRSSQNDPQKEAAVGEIAEKLGFERIVCDLLYNRGYQTPRDARRFINLEDEMLCDPFSMLDMNEAVDRIHRAVEKHEKIVVYGDYDVDGVTSVATIVLYLRSLGADVSFYIPNRLGEGYGVSSQAIEALAGDGANLIVTVDTGTTANAEVEFAKQLGVDFVITDHHECLAELPAAVALVNPHRPGCTYSFKELAGVGVVFKVLCAYEEKYAGKNKRQAAKDIFMRFADLVAIGTIADVMPVREENRIIVRYGLAVIESSPRVGILALIDAAMNRSDAKNERQKRPKITSGYIGYTLAPRINAAGRIRTASIAVDLFLTDDRAVADEIAKELCLANKERQNEENTIMAEAKAKLESWDVDENPVIVLDSDHWHHGVIGIVSSRVTEKYCRPSILVSFDGTGDQASPDDIGKGSGRSVHGMNLVEALCACSDRLVKFGGHELAAGLSVKRSELPAFIEEINAFARQNLLTDAMVPTVEADCEVRFSDLSMKLVGDLHKLEPFGIGNPVPSFVLRGIGVAEVFPVSGGKHTRLVLTDGRTTLQSMFFSASPESLGVSVGDTADILFNLDINEWMGRKTLQLILKDLKIVLTKKDREERELSRFDEIAKGACYSSAENVLPTYDDFGTFYRFVEHSYRDGTLRPVGHRQLMAKLSTPERPIGYIKLKFMIRVFEELNILGIEEISPEVYAFSLRYSSAKTSLDKSGVLRRLKSQQTD